MSATVSTRISQALATALTLSTGSVHAVLGIDLRSDTLAARAEFPAQAQAGVLEAFTWSSAGNRSRLHHDPTGPVKAKAPPRRLSLRPGGVGASPAQADGEWHRPRPRRHAFQMRQRAHCRAAQAPHARRDGLRFLWSGCNNCDAPTGVRPHLASRISHIGGVIASRLRNAEAAVKYRQSVMQVQNFHRGRTFGMAKGRVPFDAKVVAGDAMVLDTIGKLPFVAFGEGADKGANSRAKFDAAAVGQSCKACHDACQAPQ